MSMDRDTGKDTSKDTSIDMKSGDRPHPRGGKLFGIGVGPGEPGLLTLEAVKALQEARVIAVPQARAGGESVALKTIRGLDDIHRPVLEGKEILELVFPMTGDPGVLGKAWQEAAGEVGSRIEKGTSVAFATLGDPSLYSTFSYLVSTLGEEFRARDRELVVEIIPGINSFSAAASRLQVPLVEGNENLAVIPFHAGNKDKLKLILSLFDTVVLLKVHRSLDQILPVLEESGLLDCSYFVSRVGDEKEFISHDLKGLVGQRLDYLSLMIIKKK